jgi:hypothetical protein
LDTLLEGKSFDPNNWEKALVSQAYNKEKIKLLKKRRPKKLPPLETKLIFKFNWNLALTSW